MMSRPRFLRCPRFLLLVPFALVAASVAGAQCPDGSPPPCRSQTVAAAPRRVNPPLDDRTWIVVPFDNLAKTEDVDWLRNAAVNLLYLDMSRWRDIRVVDDERVADLLRETPEAGTTQAMSLNAGLAVAKRAGAGRLVMGDLLKLGSRTAITAKVFNVRTGQRIRSVREETAIQDSVMPLFSRLAQRILNVAPPQGANIGALGTSRVDAYQEYLAGVQALNRFDLREAHSRLDKAIALDSAFALAHYKQSVTLGWFSLNEPARRAHAEAAARLLVGLPARERALIRGQLHQTTGDWTDACQTYGELLTSDSLDVEAWYGLGECLYHNQTVMAVDGDAKRLRFRADWQQSIRAFERVLQLDPQYHLAYQHIIDALTVERHTNATYCTDERQCSGQYTAYLIRVGDSLVTAPVETRTDTAALRAQGERYVVTQSRRRNLAAAAEVAERWVRAAPDEGRAYGALAQVLLSQGQVARADSAMRRANPAGSFVEELRRVFHRMEIAHKLGRPGAAAQLYDSVRALTVAIPGTRIHAGNAIAGYGPAFGRLTEFDSLMTIGMRTSNAPPAALAFQQRAVRAMIGGPVDDSLMVNELAMFERASAARGVRAATAAIASTLVFALRAPRPVWPRLDSAVTDPKLRPALALSRGDTAALRIAARGLDSLLHQVVASGGSDTVYAVVAADAYLALGDTTAALRTLRFALDTASALASYFPLSTAGFTAAAFAPRLMLLRADLAAAKGYRDEARVWYDRFIAAWSTAVPELQPVVERARAARAGVGGT